VLDDGLPTGGPREGRQRRRRRSRPSPVRVGRGRRRRVAGPGSCPVFKPTPRRPHRERVRILDV